jgi:hypothetical protein
MYGFVITLLNIGKNFISFLQVLGIVHVKNMHDHPIDNLSLAIHLGVEGHGFGEIGVQP